MEIVVRDWENFAGVDGRNKAEVLWLDTDTPQDSWGVGVHSVCVHVISCICAALCRE